MVFTPDRCLPDATPPGPGGDGIIETNPAALEELKQVPREAAQPRESDRFADLDLDGCTFGGSPSGVELGAEHRTAHAIITAGVEGTRGAGGRGVGVGSTTWSGEWGP